MKPVILDDSKALNELTTDFSNGLGRLSECTDPRVIEEANGIYEAEFDIPVTAKHFSDLHVDGIVKLKANEYDENQLFRIYRITKPLNGICHVSLQHISYDMTKVAVRPFNTVGAGATMQAIQNNMVGSYPFIFSTDISNTLSSYRVVTPCSARSCIGGREGSFIDVFGGEIHWNNLHVNVMAHRGSDRGVRIAYGKNLVDYRQEVNNSNVYTSVLGYVVKDEIVTTGNIQHAIQSNHPKTLIVDFSSEFDSDEEITVAKVDAKTLAYIQSHDIGTPNVNIDVDFIHLWQTEEYKEIASLERVSLFDTVHVFIPKLNVEATAKVVKTIYDPVEERYTKIELGNVRSNLGSVITEAVSTEIANSADSMYGRISSQIQAQIERATAFLTGAEGGYQVTHYHADGTPYETLWMNTDSEATATNILRINANGLGFSNDGGATYRNAWLIDGTLSADFIGTGTITAISIVGSSITGSNIIFGDSPNTTELRTNDEKTGALFEGNGVMQFKTKGEFLAKNLGNTDTTKTANKLWLYSSTTQNHFGLYNYDSSGASSNSLMMNKMNDSGNNTVRLANYKTDGNYANTLYFSREASASSIYLTNYNNTNTNEMNFIQMNHYPGNNWNRLLFQNNWVNGATANWIQISNAGTTSDFQFYNYNSDGNHANTMFLNSTSGENKITITNYQRSAKNVANSKLEMNGDITFTCQNRAAFTFNGNGCQFGVHGAKNGVFISAVNDARISDSAYTPYVIKLMATNGVYIYDRENPNGKRL